MTVRSRLKKRPHNLHRCSNIEELATELGRRDIDPVSLVREFVKPSCATGILVAGSIAQGIATEVSDLDLLVLMPTRDAFKERRREVAGSVVKYLPSDSPDRAQVSLFVGGIEIDIIFIVNPAVGREADDGASRTVDPHRSKDVFLNRLATGWILDGHDVVHRWRSHYETSGLRIKWMAADFTAAARNLEDMEAGIGRAAGHVSALGAGVVNSLLRALLAYNGCYCTSLKWMLRIGQLIEAADPETRELFLEGRELAFPGLLSGIEEEREYFRRVYGYCAKIRNVLCREEVMADVLASVSHDLDLIV